jgi:K+-transporting ATPase ATPase C chain
MSATSSLRQLAAAIRVLLVLTVLCGLLYPLAITGAAQLLSPGTANGSRVEIGGRVIGSSLIAQPFDAPQWFQPRPSAAGENGYDTLSSSPSNLGPNNPDLVSAIEERRAAYAQANRVAPARVPADALTASASGLDPHISVENARVQAGRVARARGLQPARVRGLVDRLAKGRTLGILGDERVNVLQLNVALQRLR